MTLTHGMRLASRPPDDDLRAFVPALRLARGAAAPLARRARRDVAAPPPHLARARTLADAAVPPRRPPRRADRGNRVAPRPPAERPGQGGAPARIGRPRRPRDAPLFPGEAEGRQLPPPHEE